jgi:hypothetical protein
MKSFIRIAALAACLVAFSPAHALKVAVYGATGLDSGLTSHGHTVTDITQTQLEAGLSAYDVLVMGHIGGWSALACTSITNFLASGHRVVTEWNGVYPIFSTVGPNPYFPNIPTPPQCSLAPGTAGQGNYVGTGTNVTITQPADPMMAGLSSPLNFGGASEYFWQITGYTPAQWRVVATYDGWGTTGNAAIMYGNVGGGSVVIGTFDYQDGATNAAVRDNMVNNFVTVGVGPAVNPTVPTLSEWALALLGALLAAAGAWTLLKRRGSAIA